MFNVLYPHFCQLLPYQRWICRSFLDKLRLRKDMGADVETLRPEYQDTITLIRSLATILSKALVFFSSSLLTTKMSFHWPATSFRSRKISHIMYVLLAQMNVGTPRSCHARLVPLPGGEILVGTGKPAVCGGKTIGLLRRQSGLD